MRYTFMLLLLIASSVVQAERIKDLASISGVRGNQLLGYGLVVGLDGTGDNSEFTGQSFKTMLTRLGVQLPANIKAESKNIAAVAIHGELPAFAKPGQKIDITVSSIGNAKSLRGGTLVLSALKAANGEVYALAQGNLVVGGFGADGKDGSKIRVNIPVVGRIPNGATVELAAPSSLEEDLSLDFVLHRNDFTTAQRMADAINFHMGNGTASAKDGSTIEVSLPELQAEKIKFISAVENITLTPAEEKGKVVVNSRTGTIIIGKNVTVGPAAITHGSLTVTITERSTVSQPLPGTTGTTIQTPEAELNIRQDKSRVFLVDRSISLESIVKAINQVGAAPGDVVAILEGLKQAGALTADMEVI